MARNGGVSSRAGVSKEQFSGIVISAACRPYARTSQAHLESKQTLINQASAIISKGRAGVGSRGRHHDTNGSDPKVVTGLLVGGAAIIYQTRANESQRAYWRGPL